MRYAIIEGSKVVNVVVATAEYAQTQGWVECPEGVGIGWTFDGTGSPLPPARDIEGEWGVVREKRNELLTASDVMIMTDRWNAMTAGEQTGWSEYRQTLRDIPQNFDDPTDVVFPETP
jgi:hypothetical protein